MTDQATLVLDTGSSQTILSTKLLQVDLPTLEQAGNASKGSAWFARAGWIKATVKVENTVCHDHELLAIDALFPIFTDRADRKLMEF